MNRPKDMQFIRIIGPINLQKKVIETLYDLKLVHFVDFKKKEDDFLDLGKPCEDAYICSEKLTKIKSIISYLKIVGEPKQIKNFKSSEKRFVKIENKFRILYEEVEILRVEENRLKDLINHPINILNLKNRDLIAISTDLSKKFFKVFLGKTKKPLDEKIKNILKNYELVQKEYNKEFYVFLVVNIDDIEKAQNVLSSIGFVEYALIENLNFAQIEKELNEIKNKKIRLEKAFNSLRNGNYNFLLDYEFTVSQLKEKAEAPSKFGSSKNAFFASGWVPKEQLNFLKSTLSSETKNKVEIETLNTELEPPVFLQNIKPAKPFEFFLKLYSLPKNYEIDPTFIIFLTFPLFFGFMLGDVGYGIFLLIMSLVVGKKIKGLGSLIPIIFLSSISSIIFGFIFGEFFGYEFINPLLNRINNVYQMLQITIFIGLFHITLGLTLGFLNYLKKQGFKHAFLTKGGWLLFEAGALIVVYSLLFNAMSFLNYGIGIMVVAIVILLKGEGVKGIIEIPSFASNVLSYTRLYAVGASSVFLAGIINRSASALMKVGEMNIVLAVFILAIGHFTNLLIGLIALFLQSTRLHYVEFFTKFFEGGGKEYSPFGLRK